ncbi:MAG: hypothetical protein HKM24_04860 [Gammaproteobacteria bacterium]|nr:hypothetical protein [Gammaproteobacteria bacterium]
MISTLLVDIFKTRNLMEIMRAHYVLSQGDLNLYVNDPRHRLRTVKSESREMNNAAYMDLLNKANYQIIADLDSLFASIPGRKIAVDITNDAVPLSSFEFNNDDLLLFGNERSGLARNVLSKCDHILVIPMYGKAFRSPQNEFRSLDPDQPLNGFQEHAAYNVAGAFSMTMYQALQQIGYFEGFKTASLFH